MILLQHFVCICCLTKYSHIQKLVFKDIMKHASTDGQITLDIIGKISYLDAFLHEVLRLHPSAACWYDVTRFVEKYEPALVESLPAADHMRRQYH